MEARPRGPPTRHYKEFEPLTDWVHEKNCDNLLLYFPGFEKEQLRVQFTKPRSLTISGERPFENIWNRFRKEFPISTDCDINKISAKFEGGILYVTLPKLINTADKEKPTTEALVEEPQPEKNVKEQPSEKTTSMPNPAEKATHEKSNELANKKNVPESVVEKEKEPENTDGKGSTESTDSKNVSNKSPEGEMSATANTISEVTLEEESNSIAEMTNNESEKRASDTVNNVAYTKMDEDVCDVCNIGKTTLINNYRQSIGGLATKVKMPRKVLNFVLVILTALVLGLYVTTWIRTWNLENS